MDATGCPGSFPPARSYQGSRMGLASSQARSIAARARTKFWSSNRCWSLSRTHAATCRDWGGVGVGARPPDRFPAAATGSALGLVSERRLRLEEAQLAFAALGTLAGVERAAGDGVLCTVLEHRGETAAG
jgi:hypothetical protein